MRSVGLTTAHFKIMVSQNMIQYNLTDWYQYLAGAYRLHLRERERDL